jgi:hypothetical protein
LDELGRRRVRHRKHYSSCVTHDWFYASEMRSYHCCKRWSHTLLNSANLHTAKNVGKYAICLRVVYFWKSLTQFLLYSFNDLEHARETNCVYKFSYRYYTFVIRKYKYTSQQKKRYKDLMKSLKEYRRNWVKLFQKYTTRRQITYFPTFLACLPSWLHFRNTKCILNLYSGNISAWEFTLSLFVGYWQQLKHLLWRFITSRLWYSSTFDNSSSRQIW